MDIYVIFISAFALLAGSMYFILCYVFDVPTLRTEMLIAKSKSFKGKKERSFVDAYVKKITPTRMIFLSKNRKATLSKALQLADIRLTAEEFVFKTILQSFFILLFMIPFYFIHPLVSVMLFVVSVSFGIIKIGNIKRYIDEWQTKINLEMPRFASIITQTLEINSDVYKILQSYRKTASAEFGGEIDVALADIMTSDVESALIRLELRINSSLLSDIIRGLIGLNRGSDQKFYFRTITFDMQKLYQAELTREVEKRPDKYGKYHLLLVTSAMLLIAVPMGFYVLEQVKGFYS